MYRVFRLTANDEISIGSKLQKNCSYKSCLVHRRALGRANNIFSSRGDIKS